MRRLGPALVAVAVMSLIGAPAQATHPRPKGATPITVSLVPWFRQCTAPNRTHGAPLAFPSCAPASGPQGTAPGTPDVNGAVAKQVGRVRFDAIVGTPGPPDDSDIYTSLSITDVRCIGPVGPCPNTNSPGPPDYPGEFQFNTTNRITDHYNGESGIEPATLSDLPFPVNGQCAVTADTSIGSTCSIATTFNTIVPGAIKDSGRTNWEMREVTVVDGGPDQRVSTPDGNPFAVQGVFVP